MSNEAKRGESVRHDAFVTVHAFGPDAVACVREATTMAICTGSVMSTYSIGTGSAPVSSATVRRKSKYGTLVELLEDVPAPREDASELISDPYDRAQAERASGPGPEEPPICEEHGVALSLYDSGDGESGPGEPSYDCAQCRREREATCPQCGAHADEGFEITSKPTRQYGGGFDTFYRCTRCGFVDVAT